LVIAAARERAADITRQRQSPARPLTMRRPTVLQRRRLPRG
jgi:hypothetical protein